MFNQPTPFASSNPTGVIGSQTPTPGLDATSGAAQPGGSDTGSLQAYLQAVQGAPTTSTTTSTSAPATTTPQQVNIPNLTTGLRSRLLFSL
jgi:hypothetical protein